jgi:hypothetical protein
MDMNTNKTNLKGHTHEHQLHRRIGPEGAEDLIKAAKDVTGRILKTMQRCNEPQTSEEIQSKEADALKKWAEQNGLLIPHAFLTEQWRDKNNSLAGSEHQIIYDAENNSVIKRKHVSSRETYNGYLVRLEIHNIISPAARYVLLGFSEVPDYESKIIFMPVVAQPVIKGRAGTFEEIDVHMHAMGFEGEGGRYKDLEEGILVHDLGEPNAIVDRHGNVVLIDPRIDRIEAEAKRSL